MEVPINACCMLESFLFSAKGWRKYFSIIFPKLSWEFLSVFSPSKTGSCHAWWQPPLCCQWGRVLCGVDLDLVSALDKAHQSLPLFSEPDRLFKSLYVSWVWLHPIPPHTLTPGWAIIIIPFRLSFLHQELTSVENVSDCSSLPRSPW